MISSKSPCAFRWSSIYYTELFTDKLRNIAFIISDESSAIITIYKYFNDVLTTFLCLERVSCIAVYAGSESSQISSKISNLCSEDEQRAYGF